MADFDKNMILPHVQCGHFALSTLSETWPKEFVFEINAKTYITKNLKMTNVTPKSKIVSYLDIILSIVTPVDIF